MSLLQERKSLITTLRFLQQYYFLIIMYNFLIIMLSPKQTVFINSS